MNIQKYIEVINREELDRRKEIYNTECEKAANGLIKRNSIAKQIFGRECELLEVKKITEDKAVMYKSNPYSGISPFEPTGGHEFFITDGQGITNLTDFENIHKPFGRTDIPIPMGYKTVSLCERQCIIEDGKIIYNNPCKSNYNYLTGNNDKSRNAAYNVFSLSDNLYYFYRFGKRGNTYKRTVDTCALTFEEYIETAYYFSKKYGVRTVLARIIESCSWH